MHEVQLKIVFVFPLLISLTPWSRSQPPGLETLEPNPSRAPEAREASAEGSTFPESQSLEQAEIGTRERNAGGVRGWAGVGGFWVGVGGVGGVGGSWGSWGELGGVGGKWFLFLSWQRKTETSFCGAPKKENNTKRTHSKGFGSSKQRTNPSSSRVPWLLGRASKTERRKASRHDTSDLPPSAAQKLGVVFGRELKGTHPHLAGFPLPFGSPPNGEPSKPIGLSNSSSATS